MTNNDFEPRHLETLDRDLKRIGSMETALGYAARPFVGSGVALAFIVIAGLIAALAFGHTTNAPVVIVAAGFGAYMALNIGANDVANNMGPAVGARALPLGGAILIAAICETAGALIAGGDVVSTIAKGIVAPVESADRASFVWAMMAALLASAMWVNIATYIGAPVSTTHSVVGGVMGAGIASAGFAAVNWSTMGAIASSWIISPVMGGVIAAGFLWLIQSRIMGADDRIAAARVWVPILVGVMGGAFSSYLAIKGLKAVIDVPLTAALVAGAVIGVALWRAMIPVIRYQSRGLENRNKSIKVLFQIPLVASAAMLSFAHGANDVANAIGPLAAIVSATSGNPLTADIAIPLWVMLIGAFGISFGLFLFGPKLIRMVGNQITKLNAMRAFCVALSASITVILASAFGLPVSSTHIAVGGVFGVGFYREWDEARRLRRARQSIPSDMMIAPEERSRRMLVRRSHFLSIVAAWIITVPAAALLSALAFTVISLVS